MTHPESHSEQPAKAGSRRLSSGQVERLWPSAPAWLLAGSFVLALAVAYGRAFGPWGGWITFLVGSALMATGTSRLAVRIEVGNDGLRAGRAFLPWWAMGRVLPLDEEQTRNARGASADPTAWLVLPIGVGPQSVVIEVTDAADPHRTWLIASRDAPAMSRAIESARGTLAP